MLPVKDLEAKKHMQISELLKQFSVCGGFTAKKLADGLEIMKKMLSEKDCTIFLSFPACIVATGIRGVLKEIIRRKFVDVVITTCGTLDHDLARIWKDYYHGSFALDDVKLAEQDIHRIGNVIVPKENYGEILEKKLQPMLKEIYEENKNLATYELVWEIGKRIAKEENAKESIIYWAWKNKIPIIIPGITDGAVGAQLWIFWESKRDFVINIMKDEHLLSDMIFTSKKTGALIIGGGISKHHTIWWNQFKGGLDYAVYITTAVEWDGSLSGAPPREAISWKKLKVEAKYVQIEGDATILLPLLFYALIDEIPERLREKTS
ncbi:MAG TPA: deoxyhypusine synthase [Nanoarchaeota archaeon]|nr:deoxyhypusine synthase [Nanoarchaeota archaeon]